MRSGWFWRTAKWEQYQQFYYADRLRPDEYKTSPLTECNGEGIAALWPQNEVEHYRLSIHRSQVIDLTLSQEELWRGIRKSYRPLINKAMKDYQFTTGNLTDFHRLHTLTNGRETRSQGTWNCMDEWMRNGFGRMVMAYGKEWNTPIAGAYFILYQDAAYYASAVSTIDNVQHAVIWTAMKRLKAAGIDKLEMGQIDGETEKEKGVGLFKAGFGGKSVPFTIARRRIV